MDVDKMDATGRTQDGKKHTASLEHAVKFVGWQTPRARGDAGGNRVQPGDVRNLEDQVQLVGWTTPSSRDWKDTPGMATTGINPDGTGRERLDQLPRQAAQAPGPTSNGFPAGTESLARLAPEFVCYLMGLPIQWTQLAPARGKRG